jgi:hypothetical protein
MPIEPDNDDIADALERLADGLPDKPQRPAAPPGAASEFRAPARPAAPDASAAAADAAAPRPPAPAKAKPARPDRPDRPDRPAAPPTTQWSEDEATEVRAAAESAEPAEYNPLSEIVDDDAVIVPAPDADVFARHAPAKQSGVEESIGLSRGHAFRRTVIPILLTCGVLLIGIGALRWIGGAESVFSDMSTSLCAALCGVGAFLLIVAALKMLQVKSELAAAAKRAG